MTAVSSQPLLEMKFLCFIPSCLQLEDLEFWLFGLFNCIFFFGNTIARNHRNLPKSPLKSPKSSLLLLFMGVFIAYELIFIIYIAFFDGFKLLGKHSSTEKRG